MVVWRTGVAGKVSEWRQIAQAADAAGHQSLSVSEFKVRRWKESHLTLGGQLAQAEKSSGVRLCW